MLVTPEKSNMLKTQATRDFPGGSVVKNLPSNAGDVAMIPGPETKIPHAAGQLSLCALDPTLYNKEPRCYEKTLCSQKRKNTKSPSN